MAKLSVSLPTYNEIASLLEKEGIKINDGQPLTIEKGTALVPPVDFRLITIRRDCADITSKVWKYGESNETYIQCCNSLYEFVLDGKVKPPEELKAEPKKKNTTKTETPKTGW